jgi:hypothetical protein
MKFKAGSKRKKNTTKKKEIFMESFLEYSKKNLKKIQKKKSQLSNYKLK